MKRELREQADVAQRLTGSLQDLVSELRLDEVLAMVTRNARSAVGGKEFALLVDEDGLRCQSSTGVPRAATAILEHWAGHEIDELWEPTTIDDVSTVDELASLAKATEGSAFGSICAAPLVFRGQHLGVLVALATQAHTFLPSDLELIQSYASQAAIALANARLYEAQEEMARRDPLTGLLNHRVFHEAVAAEIERCRRYASRFSVVVLDLDHFKQINDAHGHTRGDEVLRAVGETLSAQCRASESAFRVGGDEFAFVLPASHHDGAFAFARRTHDALVEMPEELRASFGIAGWPDDATEKNDLLARADARLYDAKHHRGATDGRRDSHPERWAKD
jgi:diguanylate cyclase (GGDEF)-like protein